MWIVNANGSLINLGFAKRVYAEEMPDGNYALQAELETGTLVVTRGSADVIRAALEQLAGAVKVVADFSG